MKVALVYDRVNKWGGAEQVLLALHAIWPEAPLFTSVYDPAKAPWAKNFDVRTSFIQRLPVAKDEHEKYPFLMGLAFEQFKFDNYDVVITVTSEFAKAIITKPQTLHLCYCLNPTGYLWSGYDNYFSTKSEFFRSVTKPLINYLRSYDLVAAARPDTYLTLSREVQKRIKWNYGRGSQVIYPPVSKLANSSSLHTSENYFLLVSRLVPNKRIDIAVKAFNHLGWPLKIVGIGLAERKLREMASKNVEFLGSLTEERLARYYEQCRAVVVPAAEDFGIVAVEAQSFGKPVIAFAGGGNLETINEGKTGWFFDQPTWEALAAKLKAIDVAKVDPEDCQQNAAKFSKEKFQQTIKRAVEDSWAQFQKHV